MKKLILFLLTILPAVAPYAQQQDFKSYITTARSSYAAGKLEDAHFALQQAMLELDIMIGKEVLKLLPARMDTLNVNTKDDNVTGNMSFVGATIHRSYGASNKAEIEIINNSPMLGTLNTLLNTPMLGGMMRDENNKTVKVQGYKARLEKQDNGAEKPTYILNLPLNSALVTFTIRGSSENEILTLANTIPMQQIAKLIQ